MKLKDYLQAFEGMDPEADLIHQMAVGCCGETEDLGDPDVYDSKSLYPNDKLNYVRITYPPFDFLSSCRKYGAARRG
jgi:hypothetical protein